MNTIFKLDLEDGTTVVFDCATGRQLSVIRRADGPKSSKKKKSPVKHDDGLRCQPKKISPKIGKSKNASRPATMSDQESSSSTSSPLRSVSSE